MKITSMTAAQGFLFLAACLPATAQVNVNPDHPSEGSSAQSSASAREAQVTALQWQLDGYEQQLRTKAEQVENARQEAVSAGIHGDGAGPFIDAYRQEQTEMVALQTALTPQIERTRMMIANPTMPAPPSETAQSPKMKPARLARAVVAASNSHEIH